MHDNVTLRGKIDENWRFIFPIIEKNKKCWKRILSLWNFLCEKTAIHFESAQVVQWQTVHLSNWDWCLKQHSKQSAESDVQCPTP